MIRFTCQKCGQAMKAALEHAGKKARCPKCQELAPIPFLEGAVEPVAAPPPVPEVLEAEEAPAPVTHRRPRDDDDDYEEDRPRRRRRRRRGGEYADCPRCGCPGDATRVYWTWWGGLVGPAIINTVRCNDCGTSYNGTTGNYNTAAIAIYFGVTFVIAIFVFIAIVLLER
jgi:hypothetical protein